MRAPLVLLLAVGPSLAQESAQDPPAPSSSCLSLAVVSSPVLPGADCGALSRATLRGPGSWIFAAPYLQRVQLQQQDLTFRFGLHSVGQLQIGSLAADAPAAGTTLLRLNTDKTFAGLLWQRENLLVEGDRLRVHGASELQWLARQSGLLEPSAQAQWLSLLGWRSRMGLEWELGQPERQIQWRIVGQVDRRSDLPNASIRLQALRHFF